MIVQAESLEVYPVVDEILRAVEGTYVNEVDLGAMAWSNELALHVIEFKTNGPARDLHGLPALFEENVRRVNRLLRPLGGRLMPAAMHPWMDPYAELRLWPHDYSPIYEAYNRIFDCRGHGWANLQSVHINLPFAGDDEFAALHAAIRVVLPLLPGLAASSPIADGKPTGFQDYRLDVYRTNAARIPSITGDVIPEQIFSEADYRAHILGRMYKDIATEDPEGILQDEWLNSRGAIARFDRNTIEIRVLDIQECPQADLAIVGLVVWLLRALVSGRWVPVSRLQEWRTSDLKAVYDTTVRQGDAAPIDSGAYSECFGLKGAGALTVGKLWKHLHSIFLQDLDPEHTPLYAPLNVILDEGTLSRRILKAAGEAPSRARLGEVYGNLCRCLEEGRMFHA
ncbi:MAG: glutamate--cysteine ligase [Candidatus Hydrogenedentes bacterium]|nr:glutamate--cysteine ligase [Candidatus Hydrogenedentota bacterium]